MRAHFKGSFSKPYEVDIQDSVILEEHMIQVPYLAITSIVYASQLSLVSLAFTVNHTTDDFPNYSLAGMIGFGIFLNYTISTVFEILPYFNLPLSFLMGGLVNAAIYYVIIDRGKKEGRSLIQMTLVTMGLQIIFIALNQIWMSWINIQFHPPVSTSVFLKSIDIQFQGYQMIVIFSLALFILLALILRFVIPKTNYRLIFQAVSENPQLASVQGVNTRKVGLVSWFISGGLTCLTGSMIPLFFHGTPSAGIHFLTTAIAGSLIGGINRPFRALLGGFIVGVCEFVLFTVGRTLFGVWFGEFRFIIPVLLMTIMMFIISNNQSKESTGI